MKTGLTRIARLASLHKAQEAEERLNFMADVAALFSKDSKRHVEALARQADGRPRPRRGLQGAADGKYVPGKSYIVE
jgi:hypothetical protein